MRDHEFDLIAVFNPGTHFPAVKINTLKQFIGAKEILFEFEWRWVPLGTDNQ